MNRLTNNDVLPLSDLRGKVRDGAAKIEEILDIIDPMDQGETERVLGTVLNYVKEKFAAAKEG